jgi:Fe-S cluster biogenesis protein NfuA/nitrite reductase/ring-hydroxylating ferredoxin subunit
MASQQAHVADPLDRFQDLAARLESIDDPVAREVAEGMVGAMLELYGEGLVRIFDALERAPDIRAELTEDGVVASLLLIHGLYPIPLAERVEEALVSVRPYMKTHGGGVELVRMEGNVAHLRLLGGCDGCAASSSTMELAIREALDEVAPDLEGVEVEGLVEPRTVKRLLPLIGQEVAGQTAWLDLPHVADLAIGAMTQAPVGGVPLLLANVGGTLLAFRNACAACGAPLHRAELEGGLLTCLGCSTQFELPLAGRALGEDLQLAPVPLLEEDGHVKVAVR